jgi:hypothetical protein
MPDLSKIFLFRMTHIENISQILEYGITHVNSPNANVNYVSIGDSTLISKRNGFILPNGRILGDYIRFYFGVCMPMLYVIQKGFNGVKITNAEDIVYCVTSVEKIISHNLDFEYTDGHAVETFSSFFDKSDLDDIEIQIDQKAIKSQYWKDDSDLDKKRRKEAEFLIADDIPSEAILGFAVYNELAQQKVINFGVEESKVLIRKGFYF